MLLVTGYAHVVEATSDFALLAKPFREPELAQRLGQLLVPAALPAA